MYFLPLYKAVCGLLRVVIWLVCYLDDGLDNPVSIFLSRW